MATDLLIPNGTSPKTTKASPKISKATPKAPIGPNVAEVVLGSLLIKPWYPSFYPEELVGKTVERLYVCQWCFKYGKEIIPFLGHLKVCPLRHSVPPGTAVYTKDAFSLYELDGEEHKLYAQNLSLFAKLFLDTKSVFYDVTTFYYYLLVAHFPAPPAVPTNTESAHTTLRGDVSTAATQQQHASSQVVGFFSKEKMSWDSNNLACICVFPPWQKQGLGQMLMGASYELGRRDHRMGGPEKPLSALGRLAYIRYWSQTLARVILAMPAKKAVTVSALKEQTYLTAEDIIVALQSMEGVLERRKRGGAGWVVNKARVREWAERCRVDVLKNPVDPEAFVVSVEDSEDEEQEYEE